MKAIVLAAGRGIRLRPMTHQLPKCLLEINGVTLLENCLEHCQQAGVEKVIVVVGHLKDAITSKIGAAYRGMPVEYVLAAEYETTNNIVSLQCALRELHASGQLDDDFILAESDVFFGPSVLPAIVGGPSVAVVSHMTPEMSGTVVKADDGQISAMILGDDHEGEVFKTVNLYYLTRSFMRTLRLFLDAWVEAGHKQQYYEAVFADLLQKPDAEPFLTHLSDDWAEVDNSEDLHRARYKFASLDQKYEIVSKLHGYFWPYEVVDHCHLYNLHFPPQSMLDYFARNIGKLVGTYPSGQGEICRLVSEWVGTIPAHLAVGNGAAEIIKILGKLASGICVSTPSFNEFEQCCERTVLVPLDEATFEFDPLRFLDALNGGEADLGVIVSPNNPTSLAVKPDDIKQVLEGTKKRVIVDESFVDFSDNPSLVPLLERYPNLIVLKSMGKVFGVCGLRLGFIATADLEFVDEVRRRLPIWNINNFAETFLRQINRYETAFRRSCERTRQDRDKLCADLTNLGMTTFKPGANFVFAKMPKGFDGVQVSKELFARNILVKHCGGKTMRGGEQYIRFGCRTEEENSLLCAALEEILGISTSAHRVRVAGLKLVTGDSALAG